MEKIVASDELAEIYSSQYEVCEIYDERGRQLGTFTPKFDLERWWRACQRKRASNKPAGPEESYGIRRGSEDARRFGAVSTDSDLVVIARSLLPKLKPDAAVLIENWPTVSGSLPFAGRFSIDSSSRDFLFLIHESLAAAELQEVGPAIWRLETGGVAFDIDTVGVKLEYHRDGYKPTSFTTTVHLKDCEARVAHLMQRFIELEPNWFLVWYKLKDL